MQMTRVARGRSKVLALVAGVCLLVPGVLLGQAAEGQLYNVQVVQVKPAMAQQYEEGVKAYFAELGKQELAYPLIVRVGDDFTYRFITPLADMADMDKMNAAFAAADEKIGVEKVAQMRKKYYEASISSSTSLVRARPDLAYSPESPRLGQGESPWRRYSYYYVEREAVAEFEQVARDWTALFAKSSPRDGFFLGQTEVGPDGPMFVAILSAKDAQDFYAWEAKANESFGQAGAELTRRTFAGVRKYREMTVVDRPDLSYVPDGM